MQRLYTAANLQDAYLLLHRLQHAGIQARVLNQHSQGGVGEIPFTHAYPEVWLEQPADMERARTIVQEHEHVPQPAAPRACPNCQEENPDSFEVCWRCGAAFDP